MNHAVLMATIIACVATLAGLVVYRAVRSRKGWPDFPRPLAAESPAPAGECFEMRVEPAGGKLVVSGRLAVFVSPGSQYSVWRQFPRSIRFHLIEYPGGTDRELPDHTLSISDTNEVYARYAGMPCDRIVAKEFAMDLLEMYSDIFTAAGRYTIEGRHAGMKTEPVSFILSKTDIL
jgi:hypothetical protein